MSSTLQFLLGNITSERFFREIYGKSPLHIKGTKDRFVEQFTLYDLNKILNFSPLLYPRVRVTNHCNTIHKYNLINDKDRYSDNLNNELSPKKVLLAIAHGGTLIYDGIQELHPPLGLFHDQLSQEINIQLNINAYYTAKGNRGVNIHFDRHDVFAIQIHGSKRWFFREDAHMLSRSIRDQSMPSVDDNYTGWQSVLLNQGDVFYCPRGTWHFTKTEEEHSAHLALGWYPLTLADWIKELSSRPEISELMEVYIQQPDIKDFSIQNAVALENLIDSLRKEITRPSPMMTPPRPHIELE